MGLATDAASNRYYATGVDEDDRVDSTTPLNTYRNDIVRTIKLDKPGDILFNIDLDIARHAFDNNAEMIINQRWRPHRGWRSVQTIALIRGINTNPDWNIGGSRHQKALSSRLVHPPARSSALVPSGSAIPSTSGCFLTVPISSRTIWEMHFRAHSSSDGSYPPSTLSH